MALTYHHVNDDVVGGNGSGDSWINAMTLAQFMTDFASVAAGDVYFFMGGQTYAMTADITSGTDGTAADCIALIGVASGTENEGSNIVGSDIGQGANRPFFDDGGSSYGIIVDDNYVVWGLDVESQDTYGIRADVNALVINCKVDNDYGSDSSTRYCIYVTASGRVVDCEVSSDHVLGISLAGLGNTALFCYCHDMGGTTNGGIGINLGNASNTVLFCILDNCGVAGVSGTSDDAMTVFGCTFYDCEDGLAETDGEGAIVVNNVFSSCGDAVYWSTQTDRNYFNYNHMHNNTDDWDGVAESGLWCDANVTSGDPLFTAVGGNDFSLGGASPCIDAGMAMRLGVGA